MLYEVLSGSWDFPTLVVYLLSSAVVIFLVMPIHEWAHGFTAYKLGDLTAKRNGRLNFNPLSHIDPVGAFSIVLIGFGWAKPVPVNPRNFKNPKAGMAITALAGPLSNIIVGAILALLITLVIFITNTVSVNTVEMINFLNMFVRFLTVCMIINFNLAIFNLIPIPPLDGSKILYAALPYKTIAKISAYERYFSLALILMIFVLPVGEFIGDASNFLTSTFLSFFLMLFGLS